MKRMKTNLKKRKRNRKHINRIVMLFLSIILLSIVFIIFTNKYVKTESVVAFIHNELESTSTDETNTPTKTVNSNIKEGQPSGQFEGLTLINDNKGIPVLCFHSIGSDPLEKNPIVISKEKLRSDLEAIKNYGYTTLTLAQLNDYLFNNKPVPEKSVVITFDDGYRNNYTNAFPILKELHMNATIFIISSYLDGDTYLLPSEVKEMSDYGIDIESHTVSHLKLATLSYEDQLKELKDSKAKIEGITGKPVTSIAYPEGIFNDDTQKAALEAGYSMGFTIDRGYADRDDKQFQLNRICLDYTYKPKDIKNVLENLKK